jgi:ribosomal protein S18 acetylase RimI-like enzyme
VTDTINPAGPADREPALGTLVAAFAADPVLRHLFPDDDTYPRYATAFFGHLFDKRVAQGTVWTIGPALSVAMWETPANGTAAEPPAANPFDDLPADARARIDAYDDTIHGALPDHPYWYLGVLGTHPDHKGRRWGRALIADGLRRAAADGLPAVLETSNPGNVDIYRRSGFEVVREVAAGPFSIWVMERPPA